MTWQPAQTPAVMPSATDDIQLHAQQVVLSHLKRVETRHRGALRAVRYEAGVLVLIAALLTLGMLGLILIPQGLNGLLIFGLSFGPIVPLLGVALWLDRHEPEPVWLLVRCFLWGAVVSTLFAGLVNSSVGAILGQGAAVVGSAPIVEEALKGAALLWILRNRDEHINGRLDAAVYAIFVGIGFAVVENVLYYLEFFSKEGLPGLAGIVMLRGGLFVFLHPFFTLATAIGVAAAAHQRGLPRVAYPFLGYLVAVTLHAMWNAGLGVYLYPIVLLPVFIYVCVRLVRAGRAEEASVRAVIDLAVSQNALPADAVQRLGPGRRPPLRVLLKASADPDHPRHETWRQRHLAWLMASGRAAHQVAQDDPQGRTSAREIQIAACSLLRQRMLAAPRHEPLSEAASPG